MKGQETIKALGGELKALYLTMGQYDEIAVLEMPDDLSYTQFTLAATAQGRVRTETLRTLK